MLSASSFSRLNWGVIAAIVAVVLLLMSIAFRIRKRFAGVAEDAYSDEERRKNTRAFVVLNIITWVGTFVAVNVLINIGHKDLNLVALVVIVGLHFFFMPALYRHPDNNISGASMIVWAIASTMIFKGDMLNGAVTLGAGVIVWISALFKLRVANNALGRAA